MKHGDYSKREILRAYLTYKSVSATAQNCSYTYSYVYKVLKQLGIIHPKPKTTRSYKDLTAYEVDRAIAHYKNGTSIKAIQKILGVSSRTIYLLLAENNCNYRRQKSFNWKKLPEQTKLTLTAETIILIQKGSSDYQIASKLNIPVSRVTSIKNKFLS